MKKGKRAQPSQKPTPVTSQTLSQVLPETVPESSIDARANAQSQLRIQPSQVIHDDLTLMSSQRVDDVVSQLQSTSSSKRSRQVDYFEDFDIAPVSFALSSI